MPTAAPQMPVFGSSPLGRCCPSLSLPFWDFFHSHLPREPLLPMPWAQPAAAIQRAFFAHCPSTGLSCGLCLPISNLSFPLLDRKTEREKQSHILVLQLFAANLFARPPSQPISAQVMHPRLEREEEFVLQFLCGILIMMFVYEPAGCKLHQSLGRSCYVSLHQCLRAVSIPWCTSTASRGGLGHPSS